MLVSIIMPVYNSDPYVEAAIYSVIQQSYGEWELIVVDDASTDNSAQKIEGIINSDSRIILIKLLNNAGAAASRNAALNRAKGRFIAFLDSDDIWYPDKLEKQVLFMSERKIPISFTSYELIDKNGKRRSKVINSVEKLTQIDYLKNTIIGFSTSMIDTKIVGNNFRMRDIRTRQDASLWVTLLGQGYIAYGMDEVMVKYRVHPQSISSNKLKTVKQVWNLYFNIHKLGFLKSVYYFAFYLYNTIKKRI